jgi:Dolichyl-phosphate-mannose-protein mannosyltransferase
MTPTHPPGRYSRVVSAALAFVFFLLLALLLDWRAGTFRSEFGRHPDEGMHYVTGLLIRDYVTSGHWGHPMQFAKNFYVHFPKVGLGQWPPVFPILQSCWSLLFGVSRVSLLGGMVVLAALLAATTFRTAKRHTGFLYSAVAGAVLLAAPLTQAQAAMVMAEIPLALFSFLSILAWIRFAESASLRDALVFALWTVLAILTKGNAWVIPAVVAVSLACNRSWKLLVRPPFWIAVAVIGAGGLPFTLYTIGVVAQGMNSPSIPDLPTLLASMRVHAAFVANLIGFPLFAVALLGVAQRVLVPWFRRRAAEPFWVTMAIYGVAIIPFHAIVPTSYEPRKIYQIAPALCLFVAAGLNTLGDWLAPRIGVNRARWTVALLALAAFLARGFTVIEPFAPGFAPAVVDVLARPDSRATAVLVSSNPVFSDDEAAIIAEWAARRRDDGTYLVRGTKLLSRLVDSSTGLDFESNDLNPEQMRRRLASVPVSYVILDTVSASHSYRHHALLRATLARYPEDWEPIYASQTVALGVPHEIQVYRYRKDVRGVAVHFEIDLTRKIGDTLRVDQGSP